VKPKEAELEPILAGDAQRPPVEPASPRAALPDSAPVRSSGEPLVRLAGPPRG